VELEPELGCFKTPLLKGSGSLGTQIIILLKINKFDLTF
jgi:hypothetical protein